ncbi:MAG: hypothetical protein M1381_01435 [Deltaproteobacteria bacterium]|nr:hypothetical protein [Deltaproteobacteria bacterium]MCL5793136.1 hypothetical protein [Deltaproteobacteria bacterium]
MIVKKSKLLLLSIIMSLSPSISYARIYSIAGYDLNIDSQKHTFNTVFAGMFWNPLERLSLLGNLSYYSDSLGDRVGSIGLQFYIPVSNPFILQLSINGSSGLNNSYNAGIGSIGGIVYISRLISFNTRFYYYSDNYAYDFFKLYDSLYFTLLNKLGIEAGAMYYFTSMPNNYPVLFAEIDCRLWKLILYSRFTYYPFPLQLATSNYQDINTLNNISAGIFIRY